MSKGKCTGCGECRQYCIVARAGCASITAVLSDGSGKGAWNCTNCWKCVEACPEDVDIFTFMMKKRRELEPPAHYRRSFDNIRHTGYSMPIEDLNTIREMWGLDEIRKVDPAKIRKLLPGTGRPRS